MRIRGWGPHDGISALIGRKRDWSSLTRGHSEKAAVHKPQRFFARNRISSHLVLGLPSLKNCEKINVCDLSPEVYSVRTQQHMQTITMLYFLLECELLGGRAAFLSPHLQHMAPV